uniref:Uncharacterized protein n=1 Tax=Peronospora matthiolae TaxID=2874970 RepID=A0AAV1TSB4_9STRA
MLRLMAWIQASTIAGNSLYLSALPRLLSKDVGCPKWQTASREHCY